jgi:hypothetical protein
MELHFDDHGGLLVATAGNKEDRHALLAWTFLARRGDFWHATDVVERIGDTEQGIIFSVPKQGNLALLTSNRSIFQLVLDAVQESQNLIVHQIDSNSPAIYFAAGYCTSCHRPLFRGYKRRWAICGACRRDCQHDFSFRDMDPIHRGRKAVWRCQKCGEIEPTGIMEDLFQERQRIAREEIGLILPD